MSTDFGDIIHPPPPLYLAAKSSIEQQLVQQIPSLLIKCKPDDAAKASGQENIAAITSAVRTKKKTPSRERR